MISINNLICGAIVLLVGSSILSEISSSVNFYKGMEIIGWTCSDEEKEEPKEQTYLDYVKERLEVERIMK